MAAACFRFRQMAEERRIEKDMIGEVRLAADSLFGVHTARALESFNIAGRPINSELSKAFGSVKLACFLVNKSLGFWSDDEDKASAIERACVEMAQGALNDHVLVDALQGGAGTSANMNVNEVVCNRALQLLGLPPGSYGRISPTDDINLHQSTNDTFPTAMKVAAVRMLRTLEASVVGLQEAFQAKEKEFAHIVKVGRTELRDAALITLGREMSAYAEALSRDRWRIYKCEERLRVVNLGGTAVGTGLAAPRRYIFSVVDKLREVTGIGFARAENLVDATQNADVFVEVSGILKALAATLFKISSDLRLLSSGPDAGIGELILPPRQSGSSIMPGKINPVIPEAASQAALLAIGYDSVIAFACASGNLELNPFLPLVAHCLFESCGMLSKACDSLNNFCVSGMKADETRCAETVSSSTATATALVSEIGYDAVCKAVAAARQSGKSIRDTVVEMGFMSGEKFDELISPEAVCRLGHVNNRRDDKRDGC
ncbi:MAG TPA: aspartate ammonia-lyase [bacterium]|nr:aspartate ammonia-lyase [bacterium]